MKKLLNILVVLVILLFIGSTLYVLELPPFNHGGPLIQNSETQALNGNTRELPDFLNEEKVGRAKTFDEHMTRGKLLEANGYPALAVAEYEAAIKLSPTSTEPLVEIGKIQLRNNDPIKAKLAFQQALQIDPENTSVKVYLCRALLADRKITEAQQVISAVSIDTQESKYYKGILAAYFGDYENGKNLLKDAVSINTTQDITAKANNFLAAYDEFNFNQGGEKIHLKTLLARSFDQTGQYQMAIPLLYEVIQEKKDYRDAWILLGYAYLNIEKYADAADALEEAHKLDSQKPETLFYLGLAYYGLNDLPKAAADLETAKKNGFQPQVQVDQKLAEIYLQMKNYNKSAASYENVLSLNDSDVDYFIKPVWIYLERLGQPQRAVALARKALKAHPSEAMSYNLLGWAYIGAGDFNNARTFLDRAALIDPDLDAVYLNYGYLSEKTGKPDQAVSYFKKAYQMGQGNPISTAAADSYNKLIGKTNSVDYSNLKADLINN